MTPRDRRVYPYSLSGPVVGPKKKKRRPRGPLILLLLLLLIAATGYLFLGAPSLSSRALLDRLPFPKELIAIRFLHNGQEVVLKPNSQCVVNPRDSIQILQVMTDGWFSWGTKVAAQDLDIRALRDKPVVIRDLLPNEDFENPKSLDIQALSWSKPLGQVSFLIQLDARDWLQKAGTAADPAKKTLYLEKALQENPGNILVKNQLAGLYFEAKKYNEAAVLYKEINDAGQTKPVLERLLAIYQIQRRVDEALATHLDLLKLSEDPEVFKALLQYVQKHKSKEEAGRFLEKHQQEIPKAFQSSLLLALADIDTQTKNWSKAAATYEKAIRSGVKDPDILYNLAVTYQQGDDPDKAIQALQNYLQKNPSDIKSWMKLGELQEKKGAAPLARKTYETILQKNPQNKEALLHLVAILEKMKDKDALQTAYEKLAQLQPQNKTVQYNLAILYYEAKKYNKAAEAFEAIAQASPKDVESRKRLLDLYRKLRNRKKEVEMLQVLARLEPNDISYYDALFPIYDEKKDYKGMIALLKDPSEHNPDSVSLHKYLLYAYLKLPDNKSALKELDQLVRLQPKDKKHLRQAANLYETSGNYSEALKKLEVLLKLDPKDKEAKDDYLRLRMLLLSKKKPG